MRFKEILEALKPSQYRPLVKGWDKERYKSIFMNPEYEHDRNGYRVYIPLGEVEIKKKSTIQTQVENELHKNGFELEDYKTGIALNKKNNQKIKIGKVLNKYNPELLNRYTSDKTREAANNRYIVVISRHPYDIAGMSTDRGWTSCMNLEDGVNRHYVPLDVKEGTIVAYVTKENDRNLENPTGRVAIKPFVNILDKDNKDFIYLGIEKKVYGTNVPGFKNVVKKWVDQINKSHKLDSIAVVDINSKLYKDSEFNKKVVSGSKEEQKLFKTIVKNPSLIKTISNPTENMKLVAVTTNGNAIQYIENPSEAIQLTAVKEDGSAIQYIEKPSEEVQLAAVKNTSFAIRFIENPSEEAQLAAVSKNGLTIHYIEKPSEEVQLAAVKEDGSAIKWIKNPSEEVQLTAVKQNAHALEYIENPSDQIIFLALKKIWYAINWIKNPSEKMLIAAVNNNWRAIRFIENPSEEIQLAAIKQDKDAIHDIDNPTPKVIQIASE